MPTDCKELHHEVELGVIIGRKGSSIKTSEAGDFVGGYIIDIKLFFTTI